MKRKRRETTDDNINITNKNQPKKRKIEEEEKHKIATIISGKKISARIREEVKSEVSKFSKKPGLAVILVGNRVDSETYVKYKELACQEVGIRSIKKTFPEETSEEEIIHEVRKLNDDPEVDGILIQLPLPKHMNEENVLREISLEKDVDGFHPLKEKTNVYSIELLDRMKIPISGKKAVVLGRSNIVGIPVAMLLMHRNATITICHSRTKNIPEIVKQADIIVAAIGMPKFVKAEWIKPGCTIIDVGINEIKDETRKNGKRLVGDVDYFPCKKIAMLLVNCLDSFKRKNSISSVNHCK